MYQSLIRPILTYACQIWFNISCYNMEKIRVFERKCLRACTRMFRSSQSNYLKYVSNKSLYDKANIVRIDNFIIQLIRNHIIRSTITYENNLIMGAYYTNDNYIIKTLRSGYVPPEAFLYLDTNNLMQNANGIPIFYHHFRKSNIKAIEINYKDNINWRFKTDLPNRDISQKEKNKKINAGGLLP